MIVNSDLISVGVDCVEIFRFNNEILNNNRLMRKIFSNIEMEYCYHKANPSQHFAVRWAGKEAVLKAFSKFNIRIPYKSIEIINDNNGMPIVRLIERELNERFVITISLTHSENIALAFVIITK